MIDSHCHFDFPPFLDDPGHYLLEAQKVGVSMLIVPAIGRSNGEQIASLSETFAQIRYALGLHPYYIHSHCDNDLSWLETALAERDDKCVAVGECGLDFAIENPKNEQQLYLLEQQLALAEAHNLPVILHCRKAHNELIRILNRFKGVNGVLHAFSGSYEQGKALIDRGWFLGIGGTITYERARKTREAVKKLPLDAMLLETDSPDMPLFGYQGQANLPSRLPLVAQMLAQLKQQDVEKVKHQTTQNSRRLFRLDKK